MIKRMLANIKLIIALFPLIKRNDIALTDLPITLFATRVKSFAETWNGRGWAITPDPTLTDRFNFSMMICPAIMWFTDFGSLSDWQKKIKQLAIFNEGKMIRKVSTIAELTTGLTIQIVLPTVDDFQLTLFLIHEQDLEYVESNIQRVRDRDITYIKAICSISRWSEACNLLNTYYHKLLNSGLKVSVVNATMVSLVHDIQVLYDTKFDRFPYPCDSETSSPSK